MARVGQDEREQRERVRFLRGYSESKCFTLNLHFTVTVCSKHVIKRRAAFHRKSFLPILHASASPTTKSVSIPPQFISDSSFFSLSIELLKIKGKLKLELTISLPLLLRNLKSHLIWTAVLLLFCAA